MSIVTFWNDDREQSGKTLTSVAVATRMAIDRNFKVLLMSTSFRDSTMKNCFFGDEVQRNLKIFGGKSNNIAVENGIEGLSKLVTSKKISKRRNKENIKFKYICIFSKISKCK